MESINGVLEGNGLEPSRLERTFETWWPQLKETLENIPEATEEGPPYRTDRDILEEILRLTRQMSRQNTLEFGRQHDFWRDLGDHIVVREPFDSAADWGLAENSPWRSYSARPHYLRSQREPDMHRSVRRSIADSQPSSEGEVQSSNDFDKEA